MEFAIVCFFSEFREAKTSSIPSKLNKTNFCGFFRISEMYVVNIMVLFSSGLVARISSHVEKSLEKFGNGMVGPASKALLIISNLSG
jgi:hypothetical protein